MGNNKFKLASLFTGCGGLDLGFSGGFQFLGRNYEELPFETVFANDNDIDAVKTYRENKKYFNHADIVFDDIRNIQEASVPDFDVITAGFPCQPFSTAGKRNGVNDDRGTLFEEVLRLIKSHTPQIIIMENVRGILSSYMPDGTPVPQEIVKRLTKFKDINGKVVKYNVMPPHLVNASAFGVPQNRHRVLIIAVRQDLGYYPTKYDFCSNVVDFEQEELLVKSIIRDIDGLPNSKDVWDFSPQARAMVEYIKRSWKDIPYEALPPRFQRIRDDIKKYRAPNFYRRFGLDEINGTITASAQPENCGILHPLENRRYSVREIARIQSFPDDFTFNEIPLQSKYKVIGNAVPPVLAYSIAKYCQNILGKAGSTKTQDLLNVFSE